MTENNAILKRQASRHTLLYLLLLLAITAISTGSTLILSGDKFLGTMPASGKPSFKALLISGIVLFLVYGVLPCLLVFSLIRKTKSRFAEKINFFKSMHWAWSIAIYIAITLIIWIFVQMIFRGDSNWLYWFYLYLAAVIILIAFLPGVRNLYKK